MKKYNMNILAIDFGTKNIGLAWCDTGIGVVLPFGVLQVTSYKLQNLSELIIKEHIDKVVIGLPLGLDGKEYPATARARAFGEELRNKVSASVEYYDERFSSQAADRMGGGVSRDERSAMVILQSYLDKMKI